MNVSITFRNIEGEEWFKQYVNERMGKLQKYIDHPAEAHVVLSVEKFRNVAEINLIDNGVTLVAKEEAKEMALAIDNAVDKIERQLKRHKERVKDKGYKNAVSLAGAELESGETEFREGKISDFRRVILAHLSLDDAILEMEEKKKRFFIYRDASSEKVCLLYRRDNGSFGLIETNA